VKLEEFPSWSDLIFHRLGMLLADRTKPEKQGIIFCIGYAALLAFLQSNVTGPPLSFNPPELLLPDVASSSEKLQHVREVLLESLAIDGIAAYKLTPNIELLCLADAVFTCPPILKNIKATRWAKVREVSTHQRLLPEISPMLQEVTYEDLSLLDEALSEGGPPQEVDSGIKSELLLEKATIHTYYGFDKLAREDLEKAKELRGFAFALTGLLGKRTKFQQKDVSQLVVLAKSFDGKDGEVIQKGNETEDNSQVKPESIDLNDDTLLDSISFATKSQDLTSTTDEANLPATLASIDPSAQPQLHPLDSAILLALASSITNTSPEDGLTREEALPYATRVLEGGSSNWQVYTQALLVRSRIEGYNSRTVERGLLQLQALVDQVVADTISHASSAEEATSTEQPTSFLPRGNESDSSPAQERLRYVFQLASPVRWELEAELAKRWVELGGLRSALDIYERLQMWAEAALCWAATEREDKARKLIRRQLFNKTNGGQDQPDAELADDETWSGPARDPPPLDAPRLYCILGDIDQSPEMYQKAWEVSNKRYARAKRSLGRYYFAAKDYEKAAVAYEQSLNANQLHQSSWFALGCALLELSQFKKASEAFSRCVQLDETDAESWSNLAAAFLKMEPEEAKGDAQGGTLQADEDDSIATSGLSGVHYGSRKNKQDALRALKRAAALKHDSYRIWQNVMIVASSVLPPDFTSILAAQKRIIELRGQTDGESCIDVEILELLVNHVISLNDKYDPEQPGLPRMVVKFIDQNVTPLITGSADLWRLVGRLALWRNKPSSALDAEEKAWRVVTSQPGWETESEKRWNEVVEATVRLCDSYESLGPMEGTERLGAGENVAKDWKFKAKTAVRGILGRGKASWESTKGWERLRDTMDSFKS
jgi:tetratricopeptide (TPR) repeat protein